MKLFISIMLSGAVFVAGFLHPALASSDGKEMTVEQLFESKCSICHSIERPKSKKKSKEGWETTVMRMKNKNGCPVTDEEAKKIIDYLAEKYGN